MDTSPTTILPETEELSAKEKIFLITLFMVLFITCLVSLAIGHIYYDDPCVANNRIFMKLSSWVLLDAYVGLTVPIIFLVFFILDIYGMLYFFKNLYSNIKYIPEQIPLLSGIISMAAMILFYFIMTIIGIIILVNVFMSCGTESLPLCIIGIILLGGHFIAGITMLFAKY